MEFNTYVRKPFTVEATVVTDDNLEEIASKVGEIRETEEGRPYIHVDRRVVPNVFKVFPGFYMTKMGDNIRFYSKKVFKEQFAEATPEITTWVDYMNGNPVKQENEETVSG